MLSLLVLGGCGDDGPVPRAGDLAPPATSGAATDETEVSGDEKSAVGERISAQDFVDVARGALDRATTARVAMRLGAEELTVFEAEGAADFRSEPVKLAIKLRIRSLGSFEIRLVDDVMYGRSGKSRAVSPPSGSMTRTTSSGWSSPRWT